MTERAILYARTSGDDRGKDNLSAQLELCRGYARAKGYRVVDEVTEDDRGASGASWTLPGLTRALDMAQEGQFEVLIARELDRLARDLAKQLVVEKELHRSGVRVEYARQEYADAPEGRLQKHLIASIAEYEREQIALRTQRGRRNRVKRGSVICSGRPPYGYDLVKEGDDFRLVPNEDEAATVRMIFDIYASGKHGLGTLAAKLTALGIATPTDSMPRRGPGLKKVPGAPWRRSVVASILRNETYIGRWTFGKRSPNGDKLTVAVPPLIDVATAHEVRDRAEANRRNAMRQKRQQYLLGGRVRCAVCGRAMHGIPTRSGSRTYTYYRCNSKFGLAEGTTGCVSRRFRADHVDPIVWTWVRSQLADPDRLAEALLAQHREAESHLAPLRDRFQLVKKLLADNEAKRGRLADLYLAGSFDRAQLARRSSQIEVAIGQLKREQDEIEREIAREAISGDQVLEIRQTARDLATELDRRARPFSRRREVVEALNIRALLRREDGRIVVHVTCSLGAETMGSASESTCGIGHATKLL